jgi:hypothetical protein
LRNSKDDQINLGGVIAAPIAVLLTKIKVTTDDDFG